MNDKFEPIVLPDIECKIEEGLDRLENSILKFEEEEIFEGCVMFTGSSGFTRWRKTFSHPCAGIDLRDDILAKDGSKICVNHGFGSSTMHELCYYYERIIRPWKPKALVVTSYLNDYAQGYTNEEIMVFVEWLTKQATKDFPNIKIYYTDVRPRDKVFTPEQMNRYFSLNKMLKKHADENENVTLIETSKWEFFYNDPKDAGTYTNINPEMFLQTDHTHYTTIGYKHFSDYFKKVIDEVL